jgi:hypothetical protein
MNERQAMQWIRENTPEYSKILVVPNSAYWSFDKSSEWLPVLADRTSVAVVQGYEWTDGFDERIAHYDALSVCNQLGSDCLEQWQMYTGIDYSYIFIPFADKNARNQYVLDNDILIESLQEQNQYKLVYNNPGAKIFFVLDD